MTVCRKTFLTGTAAGAMLALAGTSAFAADAPRTYTPPQEPAPVVQQIPADWSGLYLGGHGGYAWGDADWDTTPGHDIDGGLGGIHGGYNWQTGNWVFGLEADISGGDISGSSACGAGTCSTELDYLGSVRGRLGWANEVFHIYATGGFAYAGGDVTDTGIGYSDDVSPVGGVVGGGTEYKISEALSARLEVLHYMFEEEDVGGGVESVDMDATVARAGLTWHFNTY